MYQNFITSKNSPEFLKLIMSHPGNVFSIDLIFLLLKYGDSILLMSEKRLYLIPLK